MNVLNFFRQYRQFFRYCVVGVSGTLLDVFSLFIFVEYFRIPLLVSATLSFLLAVINNYILNKIWTFQNTSRNNRKLFIKFLIVALVGLGLTLLSMHFFVNILQIWYVLAKLITSVLVLTWNFLGNKFWTFKIPQPLIPFTGPYDFDLSIVIPAYNEENRIRETLLSVDDYIRTNTLDAEIIVVSDGSTDGTNRVIQGYERTMKNLSLHAYTKNRGKGYAVNKGIEASRGEYILMLDADGSTPIEEYGHLRERMDRDDADIAVGSRYLSNSTVKIRQPFYRILMGRVGNILIRMFLINGIRDTQCGFKLFRSSAAKTVFSLQKVSRFGFDMEALAVAEYLGYRIIEVPVCWFNSKESRVRPIRDALITFKDLIYIKLNLWSGRYTRE